MTRTLTLEAISRYPAKSCRGEALSAALVEPWGLAGDRRFMLVDDKGETVTARAYPQLLLVVPELHEGGLTFRHPELDDLTVATPTAPEVAVTVFGGAPTPAAVADPAAHAWFSKITEQQVRLVHTGDPTRRAVSPRFARAGDCVAFQDGYPLTLASTSSLAALNGWIAAGPNACEGPLPIERFRANLVVRGAEPFAEDGWRRIRVGAAEFRVAKGSARCAIPTTDPTTAARGKEPTFSLAKHRRFDGKVWFATNLIPDTPGAVLRVGDEIEVVEAESAPDGPRR